MAEHDEARGVNRRTFLFEMAAIGLSTSLFAACRSSMIGSGASPVTSDIGLQLYTVRDQMEKDFAGTIERVAQIGYRNVEFAGYYNHSPEQVRLLLDRLRIDSTSSHIGAPLMRQDAAAQIRAAKIIGQDYITIPSYNFGREGVEGWKKGAAEFNQWGQQCRDAGIRLAYHNHAAEFAKIDGDTTGYEVLMHEVNPSLVDFELDLYWAVFADQDPLALFAKYPGRFAMWHVKDLVRGNEAAKSMAPVGKGTIDFKTLFAHRSQAGLKHFFVEHDSAASYPGGSLASVQTSYTYLHHLLA